MARCNSSRVVHLFELNTFFCRSEKNPEVLGDLAERSFSAPCDCDDVTSELLGECRWHHLLHPANLIVARSGVNRTWADPSVGDYETCTMDNHETCAQDRIGVTLLITRLQLHPHGAG